MRNRQWRLASHPKGMVREADFKLHEDRLPEPSDGEFVVKVDYLAFDPAMRAWITGVDTYVSGIKVGDLMRGMGVGHVIASRNAAFPEGALVSGFFGWQEYALCSGGSPEDPRVLPPGTPPTMPLSVLGVTGLTAYFGMLDVGEPKAGANVLVSGAAGATGSVASQIAKHVVGCRTVGIAGGDEKCRWLIERARLDAAIDYRAEDVYARIRDLFPQGIDVFFDNVGGEILRAALANLAIKGRIVLCGGISSYNDAAPGPGLPNYLELVVRRGRMEGFIVLDYASRFGEATTKLLEWVEGGKIAHREDIQEGFENAPQTFLRLFDGSNKGKQLLRISDEGRDGRDSAST